MANRNHFINDTDEYKNAEAKLTVETGQWLAGLGIAAGITGFFWMPLAMGIIAVVFGLFGLYSPRKLLNVITIAVGILSILQGFG